jgi:hypothetical protein
MDEPVLIIRFYMRDCWTRVWRVFGFFTLELVAQFGEANGRWQMTKQTADPVLTV